MNLPPRCLRLRAHFASFPRISTQTLRGSSRGHFCRLLRFCEGKTLSQFSSASAVFGWRTSATNNDFVQEREHICWALKVPNRCLSGLGGYSFLTEKSYCGIPKNLEQMRSLHSLAEFSYANADYQQYLDSLLEEYHAMVEARASGESVDQAQYLRLETTAALVDQLRAKYTELADLQSMAAGDGDRELQVMAKMELEGLQEQIEDLEEQLVEVLVGAEPADQNDIILEVSAGVGGQEAMLFTAEMFEMYAGYAQYKGWAFTIVECEKSDLGGVRRASALITGVDVYKHLKFEAGVHRVQRVPQTEKSGRLHTSTMTVAVLPQPTQIDISVNPKDLQVDTFRSGGAGGQHVNTTESAVRITHKPTGVVAECQQERSQIRNREVAMKTLLSRLYQRQVEEQEAALRSKRKLQVGSKGRSEKIRTYNYAQDRITDHRGPTTTFNVAAFMTGDDMLEDMIHSLMTESRLQLLHAMVTEFVENHKNS